MTKKVVVLMLAASMIFSMSACSSKDQPYGEYDLKEYVKLGDYIGIDVERVDPEEVTDEAVTARITQNLEGYKTKQPKESGTVENGDIVNIDYTGTKDGEAFEGGSAQGTDLQIGSGTLIEGFESGLIGAAAGDTVTLNLTFPEEYSQNPDLAGAAVVFTVTVNSISTEVVPELNEAFVKENTDFKTVEEYTASVKTTLKEEAEETARQSMMSAAWETVFANAEILKYPETETAKYEKEMQDYYTSYAESYSMTLDSFLEMAGMSQEDFQTECKNYAENAVAEEMVMYSIAQKEGIKISDKEYETGAQEYVDNLGFEDIAALEENYSPDVVKSSLMWEKFFEFILDKANIVEPGTLKDATDDEGTATDANDAGTATDANSEATSEDSAK